MSNQGNPRLMEHDADGIQELDNLLPRWWVWMFYLTILFAIGYMLYFHVFNAGPLQIAEYQAEQSRGEQLKSSALARFEETLGGLQPSSDPALLARGQQVFLQMCAPCHRADGGGQVGPNLCDNYWIHGSNYIDTVKTIMNGVPEKGMLMWRGVLKPSEIQGVSSYIFAFRGTTPPNPKPPENQAAPEQPNQYE